MSDRADALIKAALDESIGGVLGSIKKAVVGGVRGAASRGRNFVRRNVDDYRRAQQDAASGSPAAPEVEAEPAPTPAPAPAPSAPDYSSDFDASAISPRAHASDFDTDSVRSGSLPDAVKDAYRSSVSAGSKYNTGAASVRAISPDVSAAYSASLAAGGGYNANASNWKAVTGSTGKRRASRQGQAAAQPTARTVRAAGGSRAATGAFRGSRAAAEASKTKPVKTETKPAAPTVANGVDSTVAATAPASTGRAPRAAASTDRAPRSASGRHAATAPVAAPAVAAAGDDDLAATLAASIPLVQQRIADKTGTPEPTSTVAPTGNTTTVEPTKTKAVRRTPAGGKPAKVKKEAGVKAAGKPATKPKNGGRRGRKAGGNSTGAALDTLLGTSNTASSDSNTGVEVKAVVPDGGASAAINISGVPAPFRSASGGTAAGASPGSTTPVTQASTSPADHAERLAQHGLVMPAEDDQSPKANRIRKEIETTIDRWNRVAQNSAKVDAALNAQLTRKPAEDGADIPIPGGSGAPARAPARARSNAEVETDRQQVTDFVNANQGEVVGRGNKRALVVKAGAGGGPPATATATSSSTRSMQGRSGSTERALAQRAADSARASDTVTRTAAPSLPEPGSAPTAGSGSGFSIGDVIQHATLGRGTIRGSSGDNANPTLHIHFDSDPTTPKKILSRLPSGVEHLKVVGKDAKIKRAPVSGGASGVSVDPAAVKARAEAERAKLAAQARKGDTSALNALRDQDAEKETIAGAVGVPVPRTATGNKKGGKGNKPATPEAVVDQDVSSSLEKYKDLDSSNDDYSPDEPAATKSLTGKTGKVDTEEPEAPSAGELPDDPIIKQPSKSLGVGVDSGDDESDTDWDDLVGTTGSSVGKRDREGNWISSNDLFDRLGFADREVEARRKLGVDGKNNPISVVQTAREHAQETQKARAALKSALQNDPNIDNDPDLEYSPASYDDIHDPYDDPEGFNKFVKGLTTIGNASSEVGDNEGEDSGSPEELVHPSEKGKATKKPAAPKAPAAPPTTGRKFKAGGKTYVALRPLKTKPAGAMYDSGLFVQNGKSWKRVGDWSPTGDYENVVGHKPEWIDAVKDERKDTKEKAKEAKAKANAKLAAAKAGGTPPTVAGGEGAAVETTKKPGRKKVYKKPTKAKKV